MERNVRGLRRAQPARLGGVTDCGRTRFRRKERRKHWNRGGENHDAHALLEAEREAGSTNVAEPVKLKTAAGSAGVDIEGFASRSVQFDAEELALVEVQEGGRAARIGALRNHNLAFPRAEIFGKQVLFYPRSQKCKLILG